jgi:rod shape-determining protein MreC
VTVGLTASRRVRRRWIAFGVLVAASMALMALSSNPLALEVQKGIGFAFSPIQSALTSVARGVSGVVDTVTDNDAHRRRNDALRADNDRLLSENARLGAVKRTNEELSALLQLKSTLQYRTVAAEVTGRESSEFRRVITIGRGSSDGIALGDVAIGEGGALLGRVARLGPNFAQVILISDTESTVIGEVSSSKATGEVVGQLGGALVMQNIDSTERLAIGDQVVTAGIELGGGIRSPYPRGLVIGSVLDVVRDPNAVVQTAYIQPIIDLDKVTNVLVITDYAGGIMQTDASPGASSGPQPTGALPPPASSAP